MVGLLLLLGWAQPPSCLVELVMPPLGSALVLVVPYAGVAMLPLRMKLL